MVQNINCNRELNNVIVPLEELQYIRLAVEQSVMLVVLDQEGTILYGNDYFYNTSRNLHENWFLNDYYNQDFDLLSEKNVGEKWSGEICSLDNNGDFFWVKAIRTPFFDENSESFQYVIIFIDITSLKKIEKWKYEAHHDELTSLPNRRMLKECLKSGVSKAIDNNSRFAIVLMDLNHFKKLMIYTDT